MVKVGLLSDTHGWLDPKIVEFFKECFEVWHCVDIGDVSITDALAQRFTLHAVYGNIDGGILRRIFPEKEVFHCENVKVVITHIGGYPGHYDRKIAETLRRERPQLFVCDDAARESTATPPRRPGFRREMPHGLRAVRAERNALRVCLRAARGSSKAESAAPQPYAFAPNPALAQVRLRANLQS